MSTRIFSKRNRSSRKGFSLIEILIAMVVLTIGIMGVLGALSFGLHSSDNSDRLSKAVSINRKIMECIMSRGAVGSAFAGDGSPIQINAFPCAEIFDVSGTGYTTEDYQNYTRQITIEDIIDNPGIDRIHPASTWEKRGGITQFARVTVEVFYRDRWNVQKSVRSVAYDRL